MSPIFDVEFEVFCECGAGICNNTTVRKSRSRGVDQIVVEPCSDCIENAVEKGIQKAKNEWESEFDERIKEAIDQAREEWELDKI